MKMQPRRLQPKIRWIETSQTGATQDSRDRDAYRLSEAERAIKEATLLRTTASLDEGPADSFLFGRSHRRRGGGRTVPSPLRSAAVDSSTSAGGANPMSSSPQRTTAIGPPHVAILQNPPTSTPLTRSNAVEIPNFNAYEMEEGEADDNASELEKTLQKRVGQVEVDIARLEASFPGISLDGTPGETQNQQALSNVGPNTAHGISNTPPSGPPGQQGQRVKSFPGANRREARVLDLQESIRTFCASHLRIKRLTGPSGELIETEYPAEPTNANTVWQTKEDLANGTFTYAWSQPPGHPFNCRAVELLTKAMIDSHELSQTDTHLIHKMIATHFEHLRTKWKEAKQLPALEVLVSKKIYRANKSRCDRLFAANLRLITETPSLSHLVQYWIILGSKGTSTDEEAGKQDGVPVYDVFKKTWRSAELDYFCRFLAVYLVAADRAPRARRPSAKVSVRDPPAGLPINWYDSTFLNGLLPAQRYGLKPGPNVSLAIPVDLLKACGFKEGDEDEGMNVVRVSGSSDVDN